MNSSKDYSHGQAVAVCCLIVTVAMFRVVRAILLPELPNFSPLMAMAVCGGLLLPGWSAWIVPLAALLGSEIALAAALHYPLVGPGQLAGWACLAAGIASGRWLARRDHTGLAAIAAALFANAVLFYVLSNAVAWAMEPAYPRSFAGLWQSLTVGLPGLPPSWTFFRNAVISDFLFAGLILGVHAVVARPARVPVPSGA